MRYCCPRVALKISCSRFLMGISACQERAYVRKNALNRAGDRDHLSSLIKDVLIRGKK